jgi:hypothetical protein
MKASEVLDALQFGNRETSDEGSLTKAWLTSTGLVNYNLERPAKTTYPVLTPLRNETERNVTGEGGVAVHWKTITAIDTTQMPIGLSEGQRGGVISTTVADRLATFITYGLDDYVTYQAQWAAEAFDNTIERAVTGLLESMMMAEEKMMLGGNSSVALGTTATPTGTAVTNAVNGALSDGTYKVGCVALTHDGWRLATVAAGISQTIVRSNADGTSSTINGGTAAPSALSADVVLNGGTATQRITANVTAVRGAVAYAWYLGLTGGSKYLQQITTTNSVNFNTTAVTTTQTFASLAATDNSALGGVFSFDGLLYQTGFTAGTGAYYRALATGTDGVGTTLTTDSAGGVKEINTALRAFWDNFRIGPDTLWVSAQEAETINSLVIAGGGAPLFRFNVDGGRPNEIVGGSMTGSYLNKFTQTLMKIRIHPYLPAGTMFFATKRVPYPHPGFGDTWRMELRRDYFQVQWPLKTLKYEFGVYADGVMQVYFLPAFGIITNIAPLP